MTSSRRPTRSPLALPTGSGREARPVVGALRCYVAAPFRDAPFVREVHAALRAAGIVPSSTWAEPPPSSGSGAPDGTPEDLDALPIEEVRAIAAQNDFALASSDVVLVLPCVAPGSAGGGREMFAEARLAVAFGIPVIWVGAPRPLTAYREGVSRVATLDEGLDEIRRMRRPSLFPQRSEEPSVAPRDRKTVAA